MKTPSDWILSCLQHGQASSSSSSKHEQQLLYSADLARTLLGMMRAFDTLPQTVEASSGTGRQIDRPQHCMSSACAIPESASASPEPVHASMVPGVWVSHEKLVQEVQSVLPSPCNFTFSGQEDAITRGMLLLPMDLDTALLTHTGNNWWACIQCPPFILV